MNSRFAGVSRAARNLIGSTSADALAAAEQPTPASAAADPKPVADPPADPAEEEPVEPEGEPAEEPADDGAAADPVPPASAALTGDAKIRADERARVATVFASEHSTGRERQAADMLGTSMSADEITGLLAKSPKGSAAADPMLAALAAQQNPALGAGATDTKTEAKSAESIWDKARAPRAR